MRNDWPSQSARSVKFLRHTLQDYWDFSSTASFTDAICNGHPDLPSFTVATVGVLDQQNSLLGYAPRGSFYCIVQGFLPTIFLHSHLCYITESGSYKKSFAVWKYSTGEQKPLSISIGTNSIDCEISPKNPKLRLLILSNIFVVRF